MEYFDSKVLESFMIPEDSIVTEGFGSKVVNFIKMIFKSIGRFFKIIGNTFVNLIKKMKNLDEINSWEREDTYNHAITSVIWNIHKGIIGKSKVISILNKLDKKFPGESENETFPPSRVAKPKSEWNKEYLDELEELCYCGAASKAMIIYMAEVSDYIYGGISTAIKDKTRRKFDITAFDQFMSNCESFSTSSRSVLNSGITLSYHPTKTIVDEINKKYDTMSTDFEKVTESYKNLDSNFNLNKKITINEYDKIMERIEKASYYWKDVSNEFDKVLKSLDNEKSSSVNIDNEYFVPFQKVIMNANTQISKLTKMITDMSNNILKLQIE